MKSGKKFKTYDQIVDDYLLEYPQLRGREMDWFSNQPTLLDAIEAAALCKLWDGKRHPHQRRRMLSDLRAGYRKLLEMNKNKDFRTYKNFHEFYEDIKLNLTNVKGFGPVGYYDLALRIGSFLGLEPDKVYVHAGTREGALLLVEVPKKANYISFELFPKAFRRLTPAQLEDCLCRYRDNLEYLAK